MTPIVELVGRVAGYAQVVARTTVWLGKLNTEYEVLKLCCGRRERMTHQALTKLLRQERLSIGRGKPEAITRECFSCASRKKAEATNRKKGVSDLGPAFLPSKPTGPSAWLKARRKQWEIATREAHERQIREGVRG